jgi:hypothetical protein
VRRPLATVIASLLLLLVTTTALADPSPPGPTASHPLDVTVVADDDAEVQSADGPAAGISNEGVLTIEAVGGIDLGPRHAGEEASAPITLRITNTSAERWQVTVDGADLRTYRTPDGCVGSDCPREMTDDATIPRGAVFLRGGDLTADGDDSAIVPGEGALGDEPVVLMTGHLTGEFEPIEPRPEVQVSVPTDAAVGSYTTVLTYTIMAEPIEP